MWKKDVRCTNRRAFEYMIGVVHGDGHVARSGGSISIAVGLDDLAYADVLVDEWRKAFSMIEPVVRENRSARAAYVNITSRVVHDLMSSFKRESLWTVPKLQFPVEYVAGVFDTDGHCGSDGIVSFMQKANGNMEKLAVVLSDVGFSPRVANYGHRDVLSLPKRETRMFKIMMPLKHPRKKHLQRMNEALRVAGDSPTSPFSDVEFEFV